MKLATFRTTAGDVLAGEVRDGRVGAFGDGATVLDRLASGDRSPAAGPDHAVGDVQLLAPHAPRAIYRIGLNSSEHVRETGGELPQPPIVFMKTRGSATAPGGWMPCPAVVSRLDYE